MQTLPMARHFRLQFAHALYHVNSRGNAREAIVKTVADRQAFLDGLAQRKISRQQLQAIKPQLSALFPGKHASKQTPPETYRTHGYQMRAIADRVGLHYSTVRAGYERRKKRVHDYKTCLYE